jgi:CRISPR system Cascade subunit CasA
LANGLEYPTYEQWREPSCTITIRARKGQAERFVLRASLERAPWRELHSLAVMQISRETNGGPVALRNLSGNEPFDLWVGGLVADKAKLLDTVEAVFHVPTDMLTDTGQRTYEDGVKHAGDVEFRLRRAVSVYHKELGNNLDRAEMREQRQRVQSKATSQFWTDVERDVQRLLDVVADPASLRDDNRWPRTVWGNAVWRATQRAFDAACPHNTPRQMRAFALARHELFRSAQPGNSTDKPQEAQE